jgi:uncharacterized RDD family membrane protein YckC
VTRRALTDPTAVVARRGGAWFIDGVLCGLAAAVPALLLADAYELNRPEDGVDVERHGQDVAIFLRDTVVVLRQSELAITLGAFALAVLVFLVVLPGRRGWSPGYLAADVRLVRRDGGKAGMVRALVRTLAWVIDGIPYPLPLVAYVSAISTRRHQRVGDLLARTYVVDKRAVGRPIDRRLDADEPLTAVAEPEPLPPAEPEAAPPAEMAPVEEGNVDMGEESNVNEPPEGVPPDEPIWDRRNRRYVLWHSRSGRWLAHTEAGWAPFEQAEASPEG